MVKPYMEFEREDGSVFYLCDACGTDPYGTKKKALMLKHLKEKHDVSAK